MQSALEQRLYGRRLPEVVHEVLAEVMMRWEASDSRRVIWEILVPTWLPKVVGAGEYDVESVKCFRLALPHAMSLPAVRLFLAGLPSEPTTTPQA
eukprot:3445473-Pleurochrysis_carterae.AAC.1